MSAIQHLYFQRPLLMLLYLIYEFLRFIIVFYENLSEEPCAHLHDFGQEFCQKESQPFVDRRPVGKVLFSVLHQSGNKEEKACFTPKFPLYTSCLPLLSGLTNQDCQWKWYSDLNEALAQETSRIGEISRFPADKYQNCFKSKLLLSPTY